MWLLTGSKTINSDVKIFYHEIWRFGINFVLLPCIKEERGKATGWRKATGRRTKFGNALLGMERREKCIGKCIAIGG